MRLPAAFEEFCQFLRVEKEAAPRTIMTYRSRFEDFLQFARTENSALMVSQFTATLCRSYQYALDKRELAPATVRGRLAMLSSFGEWLVLRDLSPHARGGRVVHTYYDHISILKFIERNWGLQPLSVRSRDNLPNPVADADNPYVPRNMPAIGDLMEMFHFKHESEGRGEKGSSTTHRLNYGAGR